MIVNGTSKITASHRSRTAAVYLRQSTLIQVRDNTESTLRQYALGDEAVRLGWDREDVLVIDADLGLSGKFGQVREGFATWSPRSAWARSGRSSAWRSPGSRALPPTSPGCWNSRG